MAEMDAQQLDTLLRSIGALEPLIREHADEAERNGRLSETVVAALAEAGVFRMFIPRSLGGLEVPPQTLYRVSEEVARIDGSTGWCVCLLGVGGSFGKYLCDEAAEKIFTAPQVITGGTIYPPGKAVVQDGGYIISGRWPYASGCHHCDWLAAACHVFENGERRLAGEVPELRWFYVPRTDVTIHEDSWQVSGFCGTGSNTYSLDKVFVPEAYSFLVGSQPPQSKHFQGPLYRYYPWISAFAFPMAAVALGIAQGAIDAVVTLAESKKPAGQKQTLRDRPGFHFQLADAVALVESARAWLYASIDHAWEVATTKREASLEERGRLVLAAANATRSAARATDLAYTAAGGTANYLSSPLQRSLRDIHALIQHVATSPQQFEAGGRMLLGIEPSYAFFLL